MFSYNPLYFNPTAPRKLSLVKSQKMADPEAFETTSLLGQNSVGRNRKAVFHVNKSWITLALGVGLVGVICIVTLLAIIDVGHSDQAEFVLGAGETTEAPRRSSRSRPPTVTTSLGKVNGTVLQSRAGRDYYGFYNVPYGQPPVGELRFKPPKPALAWEGTRDGTVMGSMCTQKSRYNPNVTVEGTEDCLHLNIFTPRLPRFLRRVELPVITYFFGGGFMHGTANDFSAAYFMDEDVVIVIVESRVGALGFLNTGDSAATGNQGLKDQVLALKWVQTNIKDFGGDPKRVVAFGTSSGAMCSHAHLLSPMSNGLFSGIMSFSGTITTPMMIDRNPRDAAVAFGKAMNCSDLENSAEMLKCLRNVSAHDIALNQPNFSPSVEALPEDGNLTDIFFPDTPLNLLLTGNVNKVPWLVGVNSAEAILQSYSLILDPNQVDLVNNEWENFIPIMLGLDSDNRTLITEVSHKIKDLYFNGTTNLSKDSSTRFNFTNLLSDRYYIHPTKMAGMLQAQQSPVYWYYLTKEANVSFAEPVTQYFDPPYGVSHADEVQYFFFRPRYPYIPVDSEYFAFSQMLVKFWVSFAETGAPVNPLTNGVTWPQVDKNGSGTVWFNLDDEPKLVEPFTERMQLWDSFPFGLLYNETATNTTRVVDKNIGD